MIKEGTVMDINGRRGAVIATLTYENGNFINVKYPESEDDFYIYMVTPIEDGFKLEKVIDEGKLTTLMIEFSKKIAKELGFNE